MQLKIMFFLALRLHLKLLVSGPVVEVKSEDLVVCNPLGVVRNYTKTLPNCGLALHVCQPTILP